MKKKIILTFMVISLSVMLFGCGTNTEVPTTEPVTEVPTTEPVTEVPTTEPVTEVPETGKVKTEAENNFNYDFEGRYWVEYGDYCNGGYYFDGTNVTIAYGERISVWTYAVVDGFIVVTYEDGFYDNLCYYIADNTLYLALGEQERCFVEVDKAEFENLFY